MAQPITYLTSVSRYRRPSVSPRQRVLAALLAAMLALGGLLPGAAYAGEADSEAEGSAPPESVSEPGEEPEFDPGGDETALEELPAAAGAQLGGDAEDTGEGTPVETEPELDTEAPPPPADLTGAPPEEVRTDEEPAPPQAPVEAAAETKPESASAPDYETAPPPLPAPIENESLVAPPAPPQDEPEASEEPVPVVVSTGPPPAPPSSEQSPAPRPVATAVDHGGGRSLVGRDSHTVRPGECLWSIAEALLPAGAGTEEIIQEVQRLWRLNASRIGTGNPDMLPLGVVLRLR